MIKAVFALTLGVLVLGCAIPLASAHEKIDRSCSEEPSARWCALAFDGEIVPGDASLIERAILQSPHAVEMITFNSPGGDPFEALKIADVLNKYFVEFATGDCPGDDHPCQALTAGDSCASACALTYMTANDRSGSEIFVHRPTFPESEFKIMSAVQAEVAYNHATGQLLKELRDRGVSEFDIETLMGVPSAEVQKISRSYPDHSPWMAEWLAAKCGKQNPISNADQLFGQVFSQAECTTDAVHSAQLQAQHRRS